MYSVGEIVIHEGRAWKSLIGQNVWEPGTDGLWEELTGEVPTPDPIEAEPWKAGQQVSAGDLREYEGAVYRAIQAHTTQRRVGNHRGPGTVESDSGGMMLTKQFWLATLDELSKQRHKQR